MGNKLEIVYILPDVDAGVSTIVRNLLKFRPKSDDYYKVIFTHLKEKKHKNRISDQFNVNEQIKFEYSKYDNIFYVIKRLKKHISSPNSVIIANDGLELRMINFLKLPNPLVYIIHGDFDFYYKIAKLYQGSIDSFIAYSSFNLETLKSKIEESNHRKLNLIYYPVPLNKFECNRNKELQILFVGSLNERKGVDLLKPIYDKLLENNVVFSLKIIGSGEKEAYLKKLFIDKKNVHFIGQLIQSEVIPYYNASHILLLPTYSEGLPNVVVEAMMAGCVPVVSDIPSGIPDIIDNMVTGIRVKPGDISKFASEISNLEQNRERLNEISVKASLKANAMFEPYSQAKKYIEIIYSAKDGLNTKEFKNSSAGRILNSNFIPNKLVRAIRKMIHHPKI